MLISQIFSKKSTMMVKIFRHLRKSELMVKVSKYSIKSEAVIRRCTIKKQFWNVLNISQKKTYTWASFETKLQAYSLKLLLKTGSCSCILEHLFCKTCPGDCFCKIYFCLSRQPQPPLFQSKHFSFLNVLGNLVMNELIYCW